MTSNQNDESTKYRFAADFEVLLKQANLPKSEVLKGYEPYKNLVHTRFADHFDWELESEQCHEIALLLIEVNTIALLTARQSHNQ